MIPWERDAYLKIITQYVQEENDRLEQQKKAAS